METENLELALFTYFTARLQDLITAFNEDPRNMNHPYLHLVLYDGVYTLNCNDDLRVYRTFDTAAELIAYLKGYANGD